MPAPEDHGEGAGADQVLRIVLVVAEDLHLSRPTGGLYRRAGVRGLPTTRGRIARDRGSIRGPAVVCSKMTRRCHAAPSPEGIYTSSVIVRAIVLNRCVEEYRLRV